jgi:prepilin-type N-terminal cleavage/methylation domain-containing protein
MRHSIKETEDGSTNGHTLLEMMAVVAIVAIMASMGAPLLQQQLAQREVEAVARRFIQHAQFARQAALFGDGLAVQIVPVEHQWSRGWRVIQTEMQPPQCSRPYSVRAISPQSRLTNGARVLEGPKGNISGLASMLLDPQKASLAVLWRTEWCFGISMREGLNATLF